MILGVTGYRPQKLGGFILPNKTYNFVCQRTEEILKDICPDKCITGMAIGYDQYAANVCFRNNIPFLAAIPFEGQDILWKPEDRKRYRSLLNKAEEIIYVALGSYSAQKMQERNEYIVNHSDIMLACIRPNEISGGTFNCCSYAKRVNHHRLKAVACCSQSGCNKPIDGGSFICRIKRQINLISFYFFVSSCDCSTC